MGPPSERRAKDLRGSTALRSKTSASRAADSPLAAFPLARRPRVHGLVRTKKCGKSRRRCGPMIKSLAQRFVQISTGDLPRSGHQSRIDASPSGDIPDLLLWRLKQTVPPSRG